MSSAMPIVFDTLKYSNTLKAAGVAPPQAEAQAAALAEVLGLQMERLATRDDVQQSSFVLRGEMQQIGIELRGEIQQISTELRGEMQQIGTELRGEMHALDAKLSGRMDGLDQQFNQMKWMLGIMSSGIVALLLRVYFPG